MFILRLGEGGFVLKKRYNHMFINKKKGEESVEKAIINFSNCPPNIIFI
jgi:hypothetical protein